MYRLLTMQILTELFQDPTFIKSSKWTILGVLMGKIGMDTIDVYSRVILQCCGIIAFIATIIVTLPKIIELTGKVLSILGDTGSKLLKAIKTTFKND